jgi:hypothetical protein
MRFSWERYALACWPFNNPHSLSFLVKVSAQDLVLSAACAGRRVVAAQDTTEINFLARSLGRRGLKPVMMERRRGAFCHAMVAVDVEDEAVLGVVHASIWTRPTKQAATTGPRSIEDKESSLWIEGSTVAADWLRGVAQLIIVADRESDIYSQFVCTPRGPN